MAISRSTAEVYCSQICCVDEKSAARDEVSHEAYCKPEPKYVSSPLRLRLGLKASGTGKLLAAWQQVVHVDEVAYGRVEKLAFEVSLIECINKLLLYIRATEERHLYKRPAAESADLKGQ